MDFEQDIHYSRAAERRRRSVGGGHFFVWSLVMAVAYGAMAIAKAAFGALLPRPAASWAWGVVLVGLIVAALVVTYRRTCRAGLTARPDLDAQPDDRFRVRCAGDRVEPTVTTGFEPMFFYGFFAVRLPSRAVLVWTSISLATLSAILYFTHFDVWRAGGPLATLAAVWASGGLVCAWLWPTYFRISPGRLDILQYTAFNAKPVSTESHDLRSLRVLVDMKLQCVFLDSQESWTEIPFAAVPRRKEFVRAVLMAAVSTAPAVALPKDELVG